MNYYRKLPIEKTQIRVKFLGEEGSGTLIRPANSEVMDFSPTAIFYKIQTSLEKFVKYLSDMNQLNLLLIDPRSHDVIGSTTIRLNLILIKK